MICGGDVITWHKLVTMLGPPEYLCNDLQSSYRRNLLILGTKTNVTYENKNEDISQSAVYFTVQFIVLT